MNSRYNTDRHLRRHAACGGALRTGRRAPGRTQPAPRSVAGPQPADQAGAARWTVLIARDSLTRAPVGMILVPPASPSGTKTSEPGDSTQPAPALASWNVALSPNCVVTDGGPAFLTEAARRAASDLQARLGRDRRGLR